MYKLMSSNFISKYNRSKLVQLVQDGWNKMKVVDTTYVSERMSTLC